MLEVISSYQEFFASKASKLERTGFLPVEFLAEPSGKAERTDKCSTVEVMSGKFTSRCSLTSAVADR